MNIRDVIEVFAAIEEGLSITEPRAVTIKQIYKYLPPSKDALNTPCIMHQYRPMSEERGPNGWRRRTYAVRIQIFLARMGGDTDVWSEIAASFDEQLISALDSRVLLGEGATHQRMFDFGGQEYQPGLLEWNLIPYVGLQYEYEVKTDDTVVFAA